MPIVQSSGTAIYYETMGDAYGQPLVLIEGLGAQLIGWRPEFCERLVSLGLFVIRLDNRDAGMSEKLGAQDELGGSYELSEMAGDVCAVLNALGLTSAHIVGQSMGGMIAQVLAIERPSYVRSLVLFYTTPAFDDAFIGDAIRSEMQAPADDRRMTRDEAIEAHVVGERRCASTEFAFDESWIRTVASLAYDRGYCPERKARQFSAIMRSPDRRPALAAVSVPVAIIHGRADQLIRFEASIALAELMPLSELHIYSGMGHQVVPELWDDFIYIISRTISRASARHPDSHDGAGASPQKDTGQLA